MDTVFSKAGAVVVMLTMLTGDEVARLGSRFCGVAEPDHEKSLQPQPRPNVIFEAGMAFGRNPDRTILVELGRVRNFSDVAGRHTIRLSNSPNSRAELVSRLRTAGCPVDVDHRLDWLRSGDFDSAIFDHPDDTAPDVVLAVGQPDRLSAFQAEFAKATLENYFDLLLEGEDLLVKHSDAQRYHEFHSTSMHIMKERAEAGLAKQNGDDAGAEDHIYMGNSILDGLKRRVCGIMPRV